MKALVFSLIGFQVRAEAPHFGDLEALKKVLSKSDYLSESPTLDVAGVPQPYDPVLWSVVASLKSRNPVRDDNRWVEIDLPPTGNSEICPGTVKSYLHLSRHPHAPTFVIFPGAFATWQRGSFVNQTADAIQKKWGDVNLLSFAGYLSPEFLSGICVKIPWNTIELADNLLDRIQMLFRALPMDPETTGVVGFSGGAYITLAMMGKDADRQTKVFGLGGMAFSPIIWGRTVFGILDGGHRRSHIDPSLSLSSWDHENLATIAQTYLDHGRLPDWLDIVGFFERDPQAFIDRTYNDFTTDSLYDIVKDVSATIKVPLSFEDVFLREGFQKDTGVSDDQLDRRFDEATDLTPLVQKIDRPTLIYFSQDDPIQSAFPGNPQPVEITQFFRDVKANPHVLIFNPRYGAHTGALLDHIFYDLF